MADFEEKLNAILSSPEEMGKIMEMAKSLSGGAADMGQDDSAPVDPRMMRVMTRVMSEYSGGIGDKGALLGAIRPYLKSDRREYVDAAAEIVKLTRLAKAALGAWREGDIDV